MAQAPLPPPKESQRNYKKRICLDVESVMEMGLDIKLDELVILAWANDFAQGGHNKSVTKDGQEYFWFKAEKCRQDLPLLRINCDRSIQFKYEKLIEKGLLIPHPNRKGKGAHYSFSKKARKLFKKQKHRVLSNSPQWESYKQSLLAMFEEVFKEQTREVQELESFFEQLIAHLSGQRKIFRSDFENFFIAASKVFSNNNRVSNKEVKDNSYTLSKEGEIPKSKIQETLSRTSLSSERVRLPEILEVMAFHQPQSQEVAEDQDILSILGKTIPETITGSGREEVPSQEECLNACTPTFRQIPSCTKRRQDAQKNKPQPLRLLPEAKYSPTENTTPELPVSEEIPAPGLSREQVIEVFEWEDKSREEAIQFYQKHQLKLETGELNIPDILEMIQLVEGLDASTCEDINLSVPPTTQTKDDTKKAGKGENQTYSLAKKTFKVFSIHPSKEDLNELVRDILQIQQERDLELKVMEKNLEDYQAFIQTEGVTTNYLLQNWLKSKGNGYGKNWGQDLERVQRQLVYQQQKNAPPKKVLYTPPPPTDPDDLVPLPDQYYEITGQPKPPASMFATPTTATVSTSSNSDAALIQNPPGRYGQPLRERVQSIPKPENFEFEMNQNYGEEDH